MVHIPILYLNIYNNMKNTYCNKMLFKYITYKKMHIVKQYLNILYIFKLLLQFISLKKISNCYIAINFDIIFFALKIILTLLQDLF